MCVCVGGGGGGRGEVKGEGERVAKVSGILRHQGVQLILVSSGTRPAALVAGKGRGGMFLILLFLYFHSCSSFFPVLVFDLHLLSVLSLRDETNQMTHKG